MRIQELTADAALENLNSGFAGLDDQEAARRLAEYGPNRVERVRTVPIGLRFLANFTHLFALVLWTAAALAAVAEWRQPGEGMGTLAGAIVLVIMVNGLFAFWQEYRSERALETLRDLLPNAVTVRRGGRLIQVAAGTLVPGDLLILDEGAAVPADCRIVRGVGVRLNLSSVTGESVAVSRDDRPDPTPDPTAAHNILPAGTTVVSGQTEAVVFATGMHTVLGGIAQITQTAGTSLSPLQREVVHLSRVISAVALAVGMIFFAIGMSLGMTLWQASIFAIGLMAALVPEGLLPTVTLALAMAGQRLAKKNVLVRKLTAVETLGSATVICTDKTGTLTENRMVARLAWVAGDEVAVDRLAAAGAPGRMLVETASLCQSLGIVGGRLVGDPTEIALVEMAGGKPKVEPLDGIPFDSDRRRMSLLYRSALGERVLQVKGALDALLPLCAGVAEGDRVRPLTEADRRRVTEAEAAMARDGLRVLAFARRLVPEDQPKESWESELVLLGLVGLEDPPRPEVPGAVAQCRTAGIRVIMVTGDHPRTAEAIARRIGLVAGKKPRIVVGDHLARMSATQLQLALDAREIIFARTRADQKWRIVKALQAKGETVAVTGDGVNDAPALKQADIGIAMGRNGTDVAREAADMVLVDDNFASIVAGVEEGRAVFHNIRKFLTYILTSNIPEVVPYLAFAVFKVPLALTVIQILAVDLGTDMLPALALAVEKPHRDAMKRPPRPRGERLIDWRLLARAYGFLGPWQAAAAMATFFTVLLAGGWQWGQLAEGALYVRATTAALAAIVVMQMVNLFLCRSRQDSVFADNPLANSMLPLGLATEAALIVLIVYTGIGNALFGTAPLAPADWLLPLPFAAAMLASEELRKALLRGWRRLSAPSRRARAP
ncbi:MAG: cation-translocating P-type ATPase [Solirubrobacterales bacterium]